MLSIDRTSKRRLKPHLIQANEFQALREHVLVQNGYRCTLCGFQDEKYMEIHHLDLDHTNQHEKNLVTACCLCHMPYHLEGCIEHSTAIIVAIPELPQSFINHIYRSYRLSQKGSTNETSARLLKDLYFKCHTRGTELLKQIFGFNASLPHYLGEFLGTCDEAVYLQRRKLLNGLKLLPTDRSMTNEHIDYYLAQNSNEKYLSPELWARIWKRIAL